VDYYERVGRALSFIEEHLTEELAGTGRRIVDIALDHG
jgi:hypothetical protein